MNTRFISDITNFIFVADAPIKADAVFLPGGPHPEPAEYAAELYVRGYAPIVIPSGRYGINMGRFAGVKSKADLYCEEYETECEFLTDVLMRCGVPRNAILGEDQSMHTRDNAFFTRRLADSHGLSIRKAIIVCKSFHARRCQMLYQLAFPETEILVCPVDCYGITRESWYTFEYGIDRVLGELSRCGNQFVGDIKKYLQEEEMQ